MRSKRYRYIDIKYCWTHKVVAVLVDHGCYRPRGPYMKVSVPPKER